MRQNAAMKPARPDLPLTDLPLALLGGLSPAQFMRRHWQKKPLLVRQALPGVVPPLPRAELFALAAQEGVESRLIQQSAQGWRLRHGPLPRRALPAIGTPRWTLLVQGLDLHVPAARALLDAFHFVPHARLDDLMVSWASDGGGVGPHLDSYDVFLLQVQGRRRWRIGRVPDRSLVEGLPLKILQHFEPEHEWLLEPGDMLYLPPQWGHDGTAEGECMTASVGFRAPGRRELARELMARVADALEEVAGDDPIYADRAQVAVADPGRIPAGYEAFARAAVHRWLAQPESVGRALGEWLTEPKPQVWFEGADVVDADTSASASDGPLATPSPGVRLDARSRMLYDDRHIYLNGDSWRAAGRDARLLHALADRRHLGARERASLSADAREVVQDWVDAGWAHDEVDPQP